MGSLVAVSGTIVTTVSMIGAAFVESVNQKRIREVAAICRSCWDQRGPFGSTGVAAWTLYVATPVISLVNGAILGRQCCQDEAPEENRSKMLRYGLASTAAMLVALPSILATGYYIGKADLAAYALGDICTNRTIDTISMCSMLENELVSNNLIGGISWGVSNLAETALGFFSSRLPCVSNRRQPTR